MESVEQIAERKIKELVKATLIIGAKRGRTDYPSTEELEPLIEQHIDSMSNRFLEIFFTKDLNKTTKTNNMEKTKIYSEKGEELHFDENDNLIREKTISGVDYVKDLTDKINAITIELSEHVKKMSTLNKITIRYSIQEEHSKKFNEIGEFNYFILSDKPENELKQIFSEHFYSKYTKAYSIDNIDIKKKFIYQGVLYDLNFDSIL